MGGVFWLAAGAALAAGSPASAADQFDLTCKGTEQLNAAARKKPAERVYRVDLARKVWCIEDCTIVLPIAEVNEARLVFQKLTRYGFEVQHWADRATGAVRDVDFQGKCEATPYTPIPERRF